MIKACLYVREDPALMNNRFYTESTLYGMKSDMYMYVGLKKDFEKAGVDLSTQDINPVQDAKIVIVLNETLFFRDYKKPAGQKLYLILSEPPVYNFGDWQKENHKAFDKVFVYDDRIADHKKYIFYNFAIDFESFPKVAPVTREVFNTRRLCALMAGSFSVVEHKKEMQSLLHERYRAIRWFNRHFPDHLDFFSRASLESKLEQFRGASVLRKVFPALVKRIGKFRYKRNCAGVFKGSADADKKIEMLHGYRFYLCFENTYGINGLISEKMFDCFAAACVPVYKGAPDIGRYVPKDCYIDFDDFGSYGELHSFMAGMDYAAYSKYIENINTFMNSGLTKPFRVSTFTHTIISNVEL